MRRAEWLAGPAPGVLTRFGEPALFREGLYRVAGGSHAFMVPNGSWGENNVGIVDCGGESVLVDTCWDLARTRAMLAAAAPLLGRAPAGTVVNTHSDGDHCWGNQLFPDRPIVATNACVRQMAHLPPGALQSLKRLAGVLGHVPVAGLDRLGRYAARMLAPYDFADVQLTLPTVGFDGEKVLSVRGVELVLLEVGPAHTEGDALVFVPRDRVVYTGDLLFVGSTPVVWAGTCASSVAGLRRLLALDADVFVPGHGPLATRADVQEVIDYWEYVHEALRRSRAAGMSPLEAARSLALSADFRSRPFARWDSPERLVTTAHTLYRGWSAAPSRRPGTLDLLKVMRRQASLAVELPEATPRVMHRDLMTRRRPPARG
jgi:glyoxylase-like metal-dependent hydrolase (beta-lactamase superfamily II)